MRLDVPIFVTQSRQSCRFKLKINAMKKLLAIQLLLVIMSIAGWGQCIYKAVKCNWEPVGKAEIIYTLGVFTGTGAIIGWFNIEDK